MRKRRLASSIGLAIWVLYLVLSSNPSLATETKAPISIPLLLSEADRLIDKFETKSFFAFHLKSGGLLNLAEVYARANDQSHSESAFLRSIEAAISSGNEYGLALHNLSKIGQAQVKLGYKHSAQKTFKLAVEIVNDIADEKISSELDKKCSDDLCNQQKEMSRQEILINKIQHLSKFASEIASAGDNKTASLLIKDAMNIANSTDSVETRLVLLRFLAVEQAKMGNGSESKETFQEAIKLIDAIHDPMFKISAIQEVAIAQARTGNQDAADALLNRAMPLRKEMIEENPNMSGFAFAQEINALLRMASGQFSLQDEKAARATIARALAKASNLPGDTDLEHSNRLTALRDIAILQAEMGDYEEASKTENIIEDPAYKRGSLSFYAVKGKLKAGDFQGALERAKMLSGEPMHEGALHDIAIAQAEAGDLEAAEKTLRLDRYGTFRAFTLKAMAKGIVKTSGADKAYVWAESQTDPLQKAMALVGVAEGILDQAKLQPEGSPISEGSNAEE
jgi:tetratricopeptide (TPR) repeat protein